MEEERKNALEVEEKKNEKREKEKENEGRKALSFFAGIPKWSKGLEETAKLRT